MKKLSVVLVLLVLASVLMGQVLLQEGFEGATFPPAGWTMIDADGDGHNWISWDVAGTAHTGAKSAASQSYINYVGELTPDNYLITPQLTMPAAGETQLLYYVAAQDAEWPEEKYSVMVSTTTPVAASFTAIYTETLTSNVWTLKTIDLSAYNGQSIYIAFRHWDCTDMFMMKIDEVIVANIVPGPPSPAVAIAPLDDAEMIVPSQVLSWAAGFGNTPTGYKMYFGTTNPPTTMTDLGNVTTWTPVPALAYDTTYFWKVVPYNAEGDAVDCPVWTFTTRNDPTQPIPFFEDFDAATTLPLDWTGTMTVMANHGTDGSNGVSRNIWSAVPTANVKTPVVGPIVAGAILKFDYRIVNWSGYPGTATNLEAGNMIQIKVGETVLYTIDSENHTTSTNFVEKSVDLSAYAGNTVEVEWVCTWASGDYYVDIDNVKIFLPVDHDLIAMNISGPIMPTQGQEATYTVNVKNDGLMAATGYSVKLMLAQTGDDLEIATVAGTELAPQAMTAFNLAWTPAASGVHQLYGKVVYAADMNPGNNQTALYNVDVQSAGTAVAYIGNPASTTTANTPPLNYYWKNSVTQSLYFESEIQAGGLIETIAYRFTGHGDIPAGTPVSIYMAITDQTVFASTSDWVPFDQFELVFDGSLPVNNAGTYDIMIPLDNPFPYGGGTLVIMAHRHMDAEYWNSNNKFQITNFAGVNRTLTLQSDSAEYVLNNLPAGSFNTTVANTSLVFNTAGMGSVAGVVTHNSQPLAGVEVNITGTNRRTMTNAQGQYEFGFVGAGTITLTATKHGFVAYTSAALTVVEDETTTHNFAMTQLPTVNVTGTVIASDTNAGLAGCNITLTGYENYSDITTNAQGQFTIPGVYTNNTYTITISKEGYQSYTNDLVEVAAANLNLGNITLLELANPPSNVVAVANDTQVQLSWNTPGGGQDVWFTHALMDEFSDAIGTGGAAEFAVAHRYSQTQLQSFGVSGATLTKVSFMPNVANATYTIKVWTGGSGSPLAAGTLVHEQAVPSVVVEEWNDIELSSSVNIPTNGELWIGYHINTPAGYPAGSDEGPQLEGFGNLMYWQGNWTTLSQVAATLTYNWMIKGMAEGASGPVYFAATEEDYHVSPSVNSTKKEISNNRAVFTTSGTSSARITNDAVISNNFTTASNNTLRSSRALLGYNIWRANTNELDNENLWTSIASNVTDTTYVDPTWANAPDGEYKYIVKAIYTGNNLSNPAFSNSVSKNMSAVVNITVNTENNGSVNGAVVSLVNNSGNPAHVYTQTATGNLVSFPSVWFGTYTLTVTHTGYNTHTNANLAILTTPINHTVTLTVSNTLLTEGFEGAVFPPAGWSLIDADGDGHNWLVFEGDGIAYNGAKCASSESYINNVGELTPDNYLITPAIQLPNATNINLKYFVAAQDASWAQEKYSVMISASTPTAANFVAVHTETLQNATWSERNIDLAEYAGLTVYIAFRHWDCTDMFRIKLDDVELTAGGTNESDIVVTPLVTSLKSNYPNPFNPSTLISFDNAVEGNVQIEVFNVKGQKVRTLVNDHFGVGSHSVEWNGTDENGKSVSSGIYFYNMRSGKYSSTRKMILMK